MTRAEARATYQRKKATRGRSVDLRDLTDQNGAASGSSVFPVLVSGVICRVGQPTLLDFVGVAPYRARYCSYVGKERVAGFGVAGVGVLRDVFQDGNVQLQPRLADLAAGSATVGRGRSSGLRGVSIDSP